MADFIDFVRRQYTSIPYPTKSFEDQIVIVTGSNVGLGFEAAKHFVRLDASKVILAVRSLEKGKTAAQEIHSSTGRDGVCEVWEIDMGNFDSVKEFSTRASRLERLDVVVENAGIAKLEYTEMEGMESSIAVNVVGTFLLALNLLPILRKSGKKYGVLPRLVITSSEVHGHSKFAERHEESIFEALKKNNPEYIADRYNTSKLLEVMMVRALNEKFSTGTHSNEPIIMNCLNPGLCHSSLARDSRGVQAAVFFIMKKLLARSTETGSRTLVAGAIAGEESSGKYMSESRVTEPSEFVRSEDGQKTEKRVYDELIEILESVQPGLSGNI